jgi:hypothetical protein
MSISRPRVIIYTNSNFGGSSYTFDATTPQSYADLTSIGFSNNISSMQCVIPDYGVTVFTGTNFTGSSWSFRGPTTVTNFNDYTLNDTIKSISVDPILPGTYPAVTLFKNSNAGGFSEYFAGVQNVPLVPVQFYYPSTALSSIILYPGSKIVIFAGMTYTGDPSKIMTYSNSTANPATINLQYNDVGMSFQLSSYP